MGGGGGGGDEIAVWPFWGRNSPFGFLIVVFELWLPLTRLTALRCKTFI